MNLYSPLFERAFAFAYVLENIQVRDHQFAQFRLAIFERIRESAGAKLQTFADPLIVLTFEAKRERDIS